MKTKMINILLDPVVNGGKYDISLSYDVVDNMCCATGLNRSRNYERCVLYVNQRITKDT